MRNKTRRHLNNSKKTREIASCEITKIFWEYFFRRKLSLGFLIMFVTGITGVQAQMLYVRQNNGEQFSFTVNEVKTITFPQGMVSVNKPDGSIKSYSLTSVHYLSFKDYTTSVNLIANRERIRHRLYPNPVSNILHIAFDSEEYREVQLSVIDLQGNVLLRRNFVGRKGKNFTELPVNELNKGLYLFRLQNQKKTETSKFLKN